MRRHASGRVGRNPPVDLVGRRGELVFEERITDYRAFAGPLFRPAFLGDKWPAIDYYVELLEVRGVTPFFFAQVKTTASDLPAAAAHLEVRVGKRNLKRLYERPGPTYLVGVHEPTRRAFALCVHLRPMQDVYRIPVACELTPENLAILHREVSSFWALHPGKPAVSFFV